MHRLIARLLLGVGVVATSAVALPPAPNSDRVDTTNVDWDQIPLTQADELDLILNADFRVADVDFYPSDSLKNPESTGSYMGISYQNIGRYAAAEGAIVRYGPGDPSDVLRDLRDDDFRPIDIEYAVTLERVQGGDFVPIERLTTFAVSNTRSRQADWEVLFDFAETDFARLEGPMFGTPLRPIDIEPMDIGSDPPDRRFVVLAVENTLDSPTGQTGWFVGIGLNEQELNDLQQFPTGRILDIERYWFDDFELEVCGSPDTFDPPKWDAIFVSWEGVAPYQQVLSLRLGETIESTQTGRELRSVPLLSAGFRPTDFDIGIGFRCQGSIRRRFEEAVIIDQSTPLQRELRQPFLAITEESVLENNTVAGIAMQRIGDAAPIPGIHPHLRLPAETGGFGDPPVSGELPPSQFAFLAAYASLNVPPGSEVTIVDTCNPESCPPYDPCQSWSFDVFQVLPWLFSRNDRALADALVDLFGESDVEAFATSVAGEFVGSFENFCESNVSLPALQSLLLKSGDGSLATGVEQDLLISRVLGPEAQELEEDIEQIATYLLDGPSGDAGFDADDLQDFLGALVIRSRVFSQFDGLDATRVVRIALVDVPVCEGGDTLAFDRYAISAYAEAQTAGENALNEVLVRAIWDVVRTELPLWAACDTADPPCSQADLAMPFGVLDGADIEAFVLMPDGGLAPPTGAADFFDVLAYLELFAAGCP